jgi:hypothetical protein
MRASKLTVILVGVSSLFWMGCTKLPKTGTSTSETASAYDVNKYPVNKTVCNPMGGTAPADPTSGIHATLSYLSADQPRYTTVSDMMANAHPSNQHLFFTDINVPTRLFNTGFPLQSGGVVNDDSGQALFEYFAIRFEGVVHLGPNDAEGDYQLGMLSDDGAMMYLSNDVEGSNYQVMVNDDGTHPTQMDCGPIVEMSKDTNLSMRIDYFQGPRYHIALVPLWRPINMSTPHETLCGVNGNSTFFDPDHGSQPLQAYMDLLSRGWRPLNSANYTVSPSTGYNPCVDGTAPVISDVQISYNVELNNVTVTWTTDVAATDQLLITDTTDGSQTLTTSDNMLRTSHSVVAHGILVNGDQYTIQVVSIAADLGKSIGAPIPYSLSLH